MARWSGLHYNALAKEIRELFPIAWIDESTAERYLKQRDKANIQRATLTTLALNLAKRFAEDNERFDPIRFLSACSPNTELYPLADLWEGDADQGNQRS